MLERLSPEERAAFLLRTVFDYEYAEIAEILGKSDVHVRQIVSRAKSRLEQDKPRFQSAPQRAEGLAARFIAACRAGDVKGIEQLLREDAEVYSDGGGKVTAARIVVRGRGRIATYLANVFHKKRQDCDMHPATVNGDPGVVFTLHGAVVHVAAVRVEDGIKSVYMTLNPDKLTRWSVAMID